MITLAALTLGAAILAAPIGPASAGAAPVTWSFFETGCTDQLHGGNCTPPQPFGLATLVLPGPTSAGSAFWQGDPRVAPVYTGDSFAFTVPSALPSVQTLTRLSQAAPSPAAGMILAISTSRGPRPPAS